MPRFLIFDEDASNEVGASQLAPNERTATQLAKMSRHRSQRPENKIKSNRCNGSLPTVYESSPKECNPSHLRRNYAFSTIRELKL